MNISPSTIPHDPGMGFSIVFQSITIHNIVQPLHIISQNYTYLNLFTLKTNGGFLTFFNHTNCLISCYMTLCASLQWVSKAMKQQRDQTLRENVERVEARDRTGGLGVGPGLEMLGPIHGYGKWENDELPWHPFWRSHKMED